MPDVDYIDVVGSATEDPAPAAAAEQAAGTAQEPA
jgi:hypothetical protein